MIMRDKIQEYQINKISDGMGGVEVVSTPSHFINCKVSVSNDVELATAYGVLVEQILNVISFSSLVPNKLYEYCGKKYGVRKTLKKGRYNYFTLVEVV